MKIGGSKAAINNAIGIIYSLRISIAAITTVADLSDFVVIIIIIDLFIMSMSYSSIAIAIAITATAAEFATTFSSILGTVITRNIRGLICRGKAGVRKIPGAVLPDPV